MTAFSDRLARMRPGNPQVLDFDYKRAIWNLFIGVGAAVDVDNVRTYSWSEDHISQFHDNLSDGLRFDVDRTTKAYEAMRRFGVNYTASTDPSPYSGQGFDGTFCDEQPTVYGAGGKLVLGNNDEVWWGVMFTADDEGGSFGRLLRSIVLEFTLEEALDNLEERITSPNARWGISAKLRV